MDSIKEAMSAISIGMVIAEFLRKTGRVLQAIEVYKECLTVLHSQTRAKNDTAEKECQHLDLAEILQVQSKLMEAYITAINLMKPIGNTQNQARCYQNLGTLFQSIGQYDKAREYQKKALAISITIGDRDGEATSYANLGTLFRSLGQYGKAREYQEKALATRIEIGDRNGEATSYGNLGTLFHSLGHYDKAREYQEKALAIKIEIGDRNGEATSYGNLGTLF